jgi:hypothetical protein
VDPLKPFSDLARTVTRAVRRKERAQGNPGNTSASASQAAAPAPVVRSVNERLRQRLTSTPTWDKDNARAIFIETILISELGEDLVRDPAFGDMVRKLSDQMTTNPSLCTRLDQLLKELSSNSSLK